MTPCKPVNWREPTMACFKASFSAEFLAPSMLAALLVLDVRLYSSCALRKNLDLQSATQGRPSATLEGAEVKSSAVQT